MIDLGKVDAGLASDEEAVRWAAAIAAGDLIEQRPWDVWRLVLRHGVSENEDTRTAVATCMLEHLLEFHFDTFFPLLEHQIKNGNRLLGDTFQRCWELGLAKKPENATRWKNLERELKKAAKGKSSRATD